MRKNKKYILGILMLAIIGIIFDSGCVQEGKTEREAEVHGDLKTVNGVRILKLNGTHYQMGYAHGFLLASDIINFINNIEVGLVVDSVNNYNSLIYFLPKAKFSQKYMDELNGMLDGMKASGQNLYIEKLGREVKIDDLKAINLMADTWEHFCSSFSAWGDFTKDGVTISGRNFDFPIPSGAPVSELLILIAYEPESPNEKKWISVATPGMIGVLTGMSEDGIGIYDLSVHNVGTSPTNFYPMALVMRDAIDNAGGIDLVEDVYGTISDKTINRGYNYHVTSPSNQVNVAGVIEGNYEGAELRYADYTHPDKPYIIISTNHWVKRSSPFDSDSIDRYERIENKASQLLNRGDQRIDSIEAREIMWAAADTTESTQFILIFQPDSKEFDLAFIDKNYRFVHFKWSDFFGLLEKQLSSEETIPPETEAKILFFENFESGTQNWSLEEGWHLGRIGNNNVLKGRGHKWAGLENIGWNNYAFKAKFKLIQGTIHFNYRHSDGPQRYFIGVENTVLYLSKQIGNKFYDLTEVSVELDNGWHKIEIRGYEDTINIYIDDALIIFYKDDNPILSGSIAFETLENSEFLIDDVEIRETNVEDVIDEPTPITRKGGRLAQNETWSGELLITDTVEVPKNVTLTIEPGTVVKFKHYRGYKEPGKRLGIVIAGTLIAVGTPENQIWFTSDASDPINGDWNMLRFEKTGNDSTLKYAVVEFAQQGINMWNSSLTISHTIVRWNNWEGIYLESYCKPLLEYNQIYENGYNGVAMEQFNETTLRYNTITHSGTNGIHVDASTARIEYNIVRENMANGLSVDDHGTIIAQNNTIEDNRGAGIGIGEGLNKVIAHGNKFKNNSCDIDTPPPGTEIENIPGDGAGEIIYDYLDSRPYQLGYIPGDAEKDRYMYIYPDEDETRRVVKKIGEGLGLTWSVTWDGDYIWTATLWGEVYKLDVETGEIKINWTFPGPQAWGMSYDGNHLWINDFAERKIYEMDPNGTVISSFEIPDKEGGAKGITWDGEYLYLMGWTTPTIYKLDRLGNLIKTIEIEGWVGGGLTWDGKDFWAPGERGICKIDPTGKIVGGIYAASEGTWDLTWDDNYLWATQRTNENWQDPKIYKIEILDDSLD